MTTNNIEQNLRRRFEAELEVRIRRTDELNYQKVIGAHYFSAASTQCLELYRDGYMLGCIMCSQALLEALLKFVAKRNGLQYKKEIDELIADIEERQILNTRAVSSAKLAWRHRNDFHHLNVGVSNIDLSVKAKECVDAICGLEEEIFSFSIADGLLFPTYPIYWNIQPNEPVAIFLRQFDT